MIIVFGNIGINVVRWNGAGVGGGSFKVVGLREWKLEKWNRFIFLFFL